jgi:methionine synthase I (cobalamin-dependent)
MMGVRAADAAVRAAEAGADVVGANCGEGPAAVAAGLEAMRPVTDLPLLAQANAGIPQVAHGAGTTWDVTPEQMPSTSGSSWSSARGSSAAAAARSDHIRAIVRVVRG